jgi:tetratricopeptide (TPR) repeat protein
VSGTRKYEDAVRCFENVLALDATQIWAQFDLGLSLLCFDRPERARAEYRRGIEVARRRGEIAASLLHVARRDLREARRLGVAVTEKADQDGLQEELDEAHEEARAAVLGVLGDLIGTRPLWPRRARRAEA